MRFSVNIPNFGDFADARVVARVASAAEAAGWDALFVLDHVVHNKRRARSFGDPWILLTAAALATTRIGLGPLVTPLPRRRPQQVARQVATLDALSGGRVIFGAGLGGPIADEYGSFGEPTDARVLAEMLDEGLGLLERYWSGEPVRHDGRHYHVDDVTLLPTPVQRPLARLRGRLDALVTDPRWAGLADHYLQVTLTDPQRPREAMARLRDRFPHTLVLGFAPDGVAADDRSYAARLRVARSRGAFGHLG